MLDCLQGGRKCLGGSRNIHMIAAELIADPSLRSQPVEVSEVLLPL